jgi:hypothetical protein
VSYIYSENKKIGQSIKDWFYFGYRYINKNILKS